MLRRPQLTLSHSPWLAAELQSLIFATVSACLVLVLRIIQELWATSGGVFNVDDVLQQMVMGLEEELEVRIAQPLQQRGWRPSPENVYISPDESLSGALPQQIEPQPPRPEAQPKPQSWLRRLRRGGRDSQ